MKDVGECSCMSMTLLAGPLDNTAKPRFMDAKQHSPQLVGLKSEDQQKGKLCEQVKCCFTEAFGFA